MPRSGAKAAGGGPYGSRRSRAKRETAGFTIARWYPTAAAVAEGIHAAWYLIRDAAGVDDVSRTISGGLALRRDHRLPSETPPALLASYNPSYFEYPRSAQKSRGSVATYAIFVIALMFFNPNFIGTTKRSGAPWSVPRGWPLRCVARSVCG